MQFCLKDDIPIYAQIVIWIEQNILLGAFKENESIPSVADISVKYKINPEIVRKGIIILIYEGIINSDLIVLNGAVDRLKAREQETIKAIEQKRSEEYNEKK